MSEQATKKVKIFLKNDFCYTGTILSDENGFIKIKDKFGLILEINRSEIRSIQEVQF